MTPAQHDQLRKLSFAKGENQEMLQRIQGDVREKNGHIYARVLATDMARIRQSLKMKEEGEWQDLLRQLLGPIDGNDTANA